MNNWQVFLTFISILVFSIYNLVTGSAILTLLKIKHSKALAFMTGVIVAFALAQVMSLPFMLNHGDFYPLFIALSSTYSFIFVISVFYLFIQKRDFSVFNFKALNDGSIYSYLLLGVVALLTFVSATFTRLDGDDAFYIAISTSIQTTGKVFFNNPSIGLDIYPFPANYEFTSYEVLITVLSQLIGFYPVIIYHTILPMVFIPTSFIACYALSEELLGEDTKQNYQILFVLIIALMELFGNYSDYMPGTFNILKSWMGKTVLINLVFPTFLCYFIRAVKNQTENDNFGYTISRNKRYFLLITLSLLAGTCTCSVGLYLLPVYYFLLYLGFIIYPRKYSWHSKFNFSVKAFISVLPIIALMIGYIIVITETGYLKQLNDFESYRSWIEEATLFFNGNIGMMALYLLSFCYFLFFGNCLYRIIFCIEPILLLLTFLNPFLHEFVGRYLTSMPVYWRLFWLIPVTWTIASFVSLNLKEIKASKWKYLLLIPVIIICNPYFMILNSSRFDAVENAEKIPEYVIEDTATIFANTNTKDPNKLYLLSLPSYNIYVRQFTGNIAMVMPRMNYVREAFAITGRSSDFQKVKNLFIFDKNKIIQGFPDKFNIDDIKSLNISLIITPTTREELKKDFTEILLKSKNYLYIRKDIYKKSQGT